MKKSIFGLLILMFASGCDQNTFQTLNFSDEFDTVARFNNQVDVLWVVDNSFDTMIPHQNGIAEKMNLFYDQLMLSGTDFRVAATTMDMRSSGEQGEFVGSSKVVTRDTPNALEQLKSLVKLGGGGSRTEQGLEAMKTALLREYSLGERSDFLREDALLLVVFLTDDRDFSLGSVNDYYGFLNVIKGSNSAALSRWVVNFIGITDLFDPTCRTYLDYAARGSRYIELAEISGGVTESICDSDFTSYVDQVSARLMSVLSEFLLKENPILDSLRVYRNGQLVRQDNENGWSYNETRNSIQFHGSELPGPTDNIKVDYEPTRGS